MPRGRTLHGALLDAELLAEVYIELIGGRQAALTLGEEPEAPTIAVAHHDAVVGERPAPRAFTRQPRGTGSPPGRRRQARRQGHLAGLSGKRGDAA